MPSRFERDTALARSADGRFEGRIDRGWWIQRGPNGGYVAALVLRAATEAVDEPVRRPRSLTVHYLRPPRPGPVSLDATIERAGRTLSTVSVRLIQDGQPMALALAALAVDRPDEIRFVDLAPPDVPHPSDVAAPVERAPIAMADRYEMRPVLGAAPFSGEGGPEVGGWIRLAEPAPIDAHVIAALADAWPPAVFSRLERLAAVPTVDLTIHFRAEVPPLPDDAFCFVRFRTNVAVAGFVEEDGEVWSPGGTMLAQSRQLAAIMPAEGRTEVGP